MKKILLTIIFSVFSTLLFSQDLVNPRLVSFNNSRSFSTGNYLLFVDPAKNIRTSRIALRDVERLLTDMRAQQRLIDAQRREIDNLKRLTTTLQRQLNEQQRRIDDLQRRTR